MMAQSQEGFLSDEVGQMVSLWMSLDQNADTRAEISAMAKSGRENDLRERLGKRMTFGTAGLRARMGAGYTCMNDLTVIQTTQGLACYLEQKFGESECQRRGVVIGYDARHNSFRFAQLTATVMLSRKFKVYLFSTVTPTPFTPFAVCKYKCVAGIMVTASHNPKHDNGYKVYWDNGAQIIPPHDKGIAYSIEQNTTPWITSWETSILDSNTNIINPLQEVEEGYYTVLKNYCFRSEENAASTMKCVYTAMHGVGYPFIQKAFKAFRLPDVIPVKEQVQPDPEFPTVKYPNPEEGKDALSMAMNTADAHGCSIIIANDPDADRLAIAEKIGSSWKVFNGNEIGSLLGWWALENYKKKHPNFDGTRVHMLASTVSSKLLRSMAAIEGFQFHETLTGFKWMGNKSNELIRSGHEVLFAFEEAIGFMFGTNVLDKDGISAGVVAVEFISWLYSSGKTLTSKLEEIYVSYGRFLSGNSYYLCHSKDTIDKLFASLRHNGQYPDKCGTAKILSVKDLTVGYDSTTPDHKPTLPTDPSSQLIMFSTENCVFTLRTSGTEPKIKYYVEVSSAPGDHIPEDELRKTLTKTVKCVVDDFLRPNEFGLIARS